MNPLAAKLSKQERSVMLGLAESCTPREIQQVMRISVSTYNHYCERIKKKLEARSIQHATLMWVRAEKVSAGLKLAAADLVRAVTAMALEKLERR